MKLHLGCGGIRLGGYLNVDVRREAKADAYHDLRGPWPWVDGSVDEVLSYHVLEHLTRDEGQHFLREAHRVLKVGGGLVLELPDAREAARQFADGVDKRAANLWGLQRNPYDFHRWGYWPEGLRQQLRGLCFAVTLGPGTDYHAEDEPCFRAVAVKL